MCNAFGVSFIYRKSTDLQDLIRNSLPSQLVRKQKTLRQIRTRIMDTMSYNSRILRWL